MKYNSNKFDNYNLQNIKVDNFRSCHVAIIFRNKFDRKKAIAYTMIADILTDVSNKYRSTKDVVKKMQDLYILDFFGSGSSVGQTNQTMIICDFIDPRYINEKDYLDNIFEFIFDAIKNPFVDEKGFDENRFNIVKKRNIKELDSLDEDNNFKSINKALNIFDPENPASFHPYNEKEFVKNITREELYDYYKMFIKESSIDVFVSGSIDNSTINKLVKKHFPFKNLKYKKYNELYFSKNRKLPKKVVEKSSYKQSTLVMLYNLGDLSTYEREYVIPFYLNILNRGGLSSKLYQNLREENGLCYNVSTNCYERSNFIMVRSTIRPGEEKKAIKLVKKSINEMKNNITDAEFAGSYYAYQRSLKGMVDSLGAITRLYLNLYYGGFSDYETKKKMFKKVTINQINDVAKKVKLNTIYVLKGDINERD